MRLKIFKKHFFTTFLIIIFSLAVMMMILSFVLNDYIADSKRKVLSKSCDEISTAIGDIGNEDSRLSDIIRSVASISEIDIFISDSDGIVDICSCEEWQKDGNCLHSQSVISKEFLDKGVKDEENLRKIFLSDLGIYKTPHYISAKTVSVGENSKSYTVFATDSISTVRSLLSSVFKLYLISAIIPILIMLLAIYISYYKTMQPLKLMSVAAKAMAKGDYSRRIPVISDDEIGELSVSFNMLTNSLAKSENMRKSFIANVSHELKTPMTTISGFIDGILDGTIEPEKQKYYLDIVSQEVRRLSRLVQSMLSMSKLESGEFILKSELFDLRELIFTIVISQEQRIASGNIEIIGLDEIPEISISADKDLIHQVIYNLLDNAIKFTDNNEKIYFDLKKNNNKVEFTLKNTGIGIPQKDIPYIFERFYKVDKSRSVSKNSTGLGLYIVKTIVTAHGGTIAISSKENEYTCFKVTIPDKGI